VKNRLLGSVALPALLAGPAMAADMPVKAPPPPAAVFSWAGFYAGLNAGGAWGRSDAATSVSCTPVPGFLPYFCSPTGGQANAAAVAAAGTGSMSGSRFTGGGQIGYNWQNGSLVYGFEADVEAFNIRASRRASANYPVAFLPGMTASTFTVASSIDTDWLFTARGRVGWAFATLLAYATGGVAVTKLSATHAFRDNYGAPGFAGAGTWSGSATKVGWTAGGGLEWAASRNWTVKVEYLYLSFGSVGAAGTIINPITLGYANAIATSVDLTAHIARAGINFKF
jgi:outer membrane immunogenic protein